MALLLRSAPIWQEYKGFAYARELARASLCIENTAGIAACETTAKAIGITMRHCICVGGSDFQVAYSATARRAAQETGGSYVAPPQMSGPRAPTALGCP